MQRIKKLGGVIVTLLFWLWAIVPKALDWVGRSTLPEDWEMLMENKLPAWQAWLFSTPWWVPALLAAALTVWIVWPSRETASNRSAREESTEGQSAQPAPAPDQIQGSATPPSVEDPKSHEELSGFVIDYLLPAYYAQKALQDGIIDEGIADEKIRFLVKVGAEKNWRHIEFDRAIEALSGFGFSPPEIPSLGLLIESVKTAERGAYKAYCGQFADLEKSCNVDVNSTPALLELWEAWRAKHVAMVAAYEQIKRDTRFNELYRPMRESRWGNIGKDLSSSQSAPQADQRPKTSEYDLPIKLGLIDRALELVGSERTAELLYRRVRGLRTNWNQQIKDDGLDAYIAKVDRLRAEALTLQEAINDIRREAERYDDILAILTVTERSNVVGPLMEYIKMLNELRPLPTKFEVFIGQYYEDVQRRIEEFGRWRFETEKALLALRKAMSA